MRELCSPIPHGGVEGGDRSIDHESRLLFPSFSVFGGVIEARLIWWNVPPTPLTRSLAHTSQRFPGVPTRLAPALTADRPGARTSREEGGGGQLVSVSLTFNDTKWQSVVPWFHNEEYFFLRGLLYFRITLSRQFSSVSVILLFIPPFSTSDLRFLCIIPNSTETTEWE